MGWDSISDSSQSYFVLAQSHNSRMLLDMTLKVGGGQRGTINCLVKTDHWVNPCIVTKNQIKDVFCNFTLIT